MNRETSTAYDSDPLRIRSVSWDRPIHWLDAGWHDLRRMPLESLSIGLLFALIGYCLFFFAAGQAVFLLAALSGFLLVAPLLAVVFYELSRRLAQGASIDLDAVFGAIKRRWQPIALFGGLLALFFAAWLRLSATLFAYLLGDSGAYSFGALAQEVFLSDRHPLLLLFWLGSGGILAALSFVVSVVSVPLLLERDVAIDQAIATSLSAVAANVLPMLLWAWLILLLTLCGFATLLLGLAFTMPLLGHASWHAYRELLGLE
jgi:uncharacterized membrane protein